MINETMSELFDRPYDVKGQIAQSGQIIQGLLKELMSHPFIKGMPPKSTGREQFGQFYIKGILDKYRSANKEDLICTLTEFTAQSIIQAVIQLSENHKINTLLVGGGGAHNDFLIDKISECLAQSNIDVKTQDAMGYSSDAKEAIAFAILGNQTLERKYGNIPEVTGAEKEVILGSITHPN